MKKIILFIKISLQEGVNWGTKQNNIAHSTRLRKLGTKSVTNCPDMPAQLTLKRTCLQMPEINMSMNTPV